MGLAFLRLNDVVGTFNELKVINATIITSQPQLNVFLTYFQNEWLTPNNMPIWNIFNISSDGHRTNNHLEGWHNHLNSSISQNANLWKFIEVYFKYVTNIHWNIHIYIFAN